MKRSDPFFIHLNIAVCAAALALCLACGGAYAAETLSVEMALQLSMEGNPLILAAEARVRQEEGRLVQVRSEQLPHIYGALGYKRLNERPSAYVFDPGGETQIGILPLGYEETYDAALNLTQVIYSGGTIPARAQAEKLLVTARKTELERTVQQVGNGVRVAFYELQKTLSNAQVAAEALKLSKEHLRQTEIFYRTGVVAKNEVLRVRVSVSTAELDLIRAENSVKVAWKQLERITGKKLEGQYTAAAGDFDLESFPVPESPLDVALAKRPELRGLEASRKAALKMIKAAKGQLMPQVGLSAQSRVSDESFFPSDNDEWSIGIVAELMLLDSGKIHGRVVEAQGAAEELLYRLEDLKREIELDVSRADVTLYSAIKKVNVAKDSVAQAEEDYRMALKRYKAQIGTNIDVLDARLALTYTKIARTNAVAEARTAYADLLYAMGEI